jgi:TonB-linked SusC/RagA family outer membrane protein
MKGKLVIALVASTILYGEVSAQYSVKLINASFNQFMEQVKNETGMQYSYTFRDIDWYNAMQKVNVSVTNASLETIMKLGLMNQPFNWDTSRKTVFITPKPVRGRLTNENNEPVTGATITLSGTDSATETDANGQFVLPTDRLNCTLVITSINHHKTKVLVNGRAHLDIPMKTRITELQATIHHVQTGYQDIQRTRTTGSYEKPDLRRFIDNATPNALSNTQWLGASLLFTHDASGNNLLGITIRGRSTLHLNTDPLVVIDNFPYEGDIRHLPINPNVVESITILKDAAATAIWGARAGNGVIIYTTRKGKGPQKASVQFNSNLTFTQRPDVFYEPALNAADFIGFEQDLFNKGYYDNRINSRSVVSPVVDILFQQKKGLISQQDAAAKIDALKLIDNRHDFHKYFYRTGINQQYTVNAMGQSEIHTHFVSVAHERNMANMVNSHYNQTTLFGNGQLNLLRDLKLGGSIQYIHNNTLNNDPAPPVQWLYQDLADDNGNARNIYADLRQIYKDTVGGGRLPDWNYRPLDDIRNRENRITTGSLRTEGQLQYRFARYFQLKLLFLYANENSKTRNYMSPDLYYVRNLVNSYTNLSSGAVVQPIPFGAIQDETNFRSETRNHRLQIDYNRSWDQHELSTIFGIEQRYTDNKVNTIRRYGYDRDQETEVPVNYDSAFRLLYSTSTSASTRRKIPNPGRSYFNKDYYFSAYNTTSYTFKNRYTVSASFRIDKSNFFGSAFNYSLEPLWSTGAAWTISNEDFCHFDALTFLKLRSSFGYSGNAIKSVASLNTISNAGVNSLNEPINIPGKTIRPEKVAMLNIGLDFTLKNKQLDGNLEFYRKRAFDLLGKSSADYISGVASFSGNGAEMKTTGADLNLTFKQPGRLFNWTSALLCSYNRTIVTRYSDKADEPWQYSDRDYRFALEGRAPLPVLGFAWMGLDPNTGDPLGRLDGHAAAAYNEILTQTPAEELIYKGSQEPRFFGSWYNQLSIKGFFVSVNLAYKAGHYVRMPTVDYLRMSIGSYLGHSDYEKRWQQPGDEAFTSVPSAGIPVPLRDQFNTNAAIHIQKADFIQLQQMQIGYDAPSTIIQSTPFLSARLFVQMTNLGNIYQSASRIIDPDVNYGGQPAPKTITVGLRIAFK